MRRESLTGTDAGMPPGGTFQDKASHFCNLKITLRVTARTNHQRAVLPGNETPASDIYDGKLN